MTNASTDDIAWVRPGKENSGTAQNLARRMKNNLTISIAEQYNKSCHEIGKDMQKVKDHFKLDGQMPQSLKAAIADYEKKIIFEALEKNPSIRQAAKALAISHTALLNKLKKYNLEMTTKRTIGNKTLQNQI